MFKWKRLFITVAIILLLLILQARYVNVDGPFRGIMGNLVNPLIYVTGSFFSGIGGIWDSYINLVNVRKENDEYKKQIDNLTLENILLQEKLNQSERLSTLIRFYKPYDFNQMTANVIGASDGYVKQVVIDRGSVDGIEKNDPVIGFQGLVGKVVNVYHNSSDVEVILSVSSSVSVINSRTRVSGILRGDGKDSLYVDYYDRLDDVHIGDVFITSGLGRLYPKGIRVGTVSEIKKDKTGLFQKVILKQSEDFYKLENVFVVKDFTK